MQVKHCISCEKEIRTYPCPHCGFDISAYRQPEYALPCDTVLNGRYLVGKVLGQGGFGITYVGWDFALEIKVAIKEYYPNGQVTRSASGTTLNWYTNAQAETLRQNGMETFLREARKMAKVERIPEVVRVRDTFAENETAYIIMDFVEGETLKEHLIKHGVLSWADARKIFFPVVSAMERVHKAGLIHRDLSPDNLMLTPEGEVYVLDLGAAKDLSANSGLSSMQVAKNGFSPLEQYTQRGGTGPWSDVYALAATMYFSLTGVLPPSSIDRLEKDAVKWDLPQLTALPKGVREALKKAMSVLAKDRMQSMGELLGALNQRLERKQNGKEMWGHEFAPEKRVAFQRLGAIVIGVSVIILVGALCSGRRAPTPPATEPVIRKPSTMQPIETVPLATQPVETVPPTTQPQTPPEDDIYKQAKAAYEREDYSEAQELFSRIPHYLDSSDYLRLLRIRSYGGNIGIGVVYDFDKALTQKQKEDIDAAAKNFDFADTPRVLLWNVDVATYFLFDDWYTQDGKYLKWHVDSVGGYYYTRSNKLSTAISNTVSIIDGYMRVDIKSSNKLVFHMTLTDPNTMELYCYQYDQTYTLERR